MIGIHQGRIQHAIYFVVQHENKPPLLSPPDPHTTLLGLVFKFCHHSIPFASPTQVIAGPLSLVFAQLPAFSMLFTGWTTSVTLACSAARPMDDRNCTNWQRTLRCVRQDAACKMVPCEILFCILSTALMDPPTSIQLRDSPAGLCTLLILPTLLPV